MDYKQQSQFYLDDGVHLNIKGYKVWGDYLTQELHKYEDAQGSP